MTVVSSSQPSFNMSLSRRILTILAAAALLSSAPASFAVSKSPAVGFVQTASDPGRLTPVLIGSTMGKLSAATETKKFFLSKTLTKDEDHSTALKSSIKKNQYVGSTALKSKGINKTSDRDKVLKLASFDGTDASGSAPIPSLIKPYPKIQKPKVTVKQYPKTTVTKTFVNIRESNNTKGAPAPDMKASGSVLASIKARQLLDPKSSYYHRPIYDYSDHGSLPIVQDKIYDFDKGLDRSKFTNGHSRPSKNYGHKQSFDEGYVNEEGQQGKDDYGHTAGHVDDSYGHHEIAAVGGGHNEGGEVISSHTDDLSYGGRGVGGAMGEAGHDKGEKGYVSKGHVDEGFDNLHRKVEYGYSETFGDDGSFEAYGSEHNSGDSFFDVGTGSKYEQEGVEDEELYDTHGEAGSRDRSDFDEKFESIKASLADELHFDDHDSYGDQGSHDVHYEPYGSSLGFSGPHGIHDLYGRINPYDGHGPYDNLHGSQRRSSGISYFPHSGAFDSIERGFRAGWQHGPNPGITSGSSQHGIHGADLGGESGAGSLGLYGVRDPLFREDIG